MVGDVESNNQFELRLCFDYISQIRELDADTRRHNVNLFVIELGAISWLLFSNFITNPVIQILLLLIIVIFVVASLYTNIIIGKTDYYCQILQAMIINGKISTRNEFVEAFDKTIPKTRNRINTSMKSASDLFEKKKNV